MFEKYTINPKNQDLTIQIIIDRIDKGFELQIIDKEELTEEERMKYNDAIIIAPDYQREYRSTIKDESSLIESILIGIPIPPIFMANDKFKDVQVMNVVDGQHRLRAFYRFVKNKFQLKDLSILSRLDNNKYEDLDFEIKRKIVSKEISVIVFKDFPGKDFELEIFNRYNKGTKPLTPQEIRHAVYNSDFNQFVNKFAQKLVENQITNLSISYNATRDRIQKKKLQESVFVILSILEYGIDKTIQKSPHYAEAYMENKSNLQKAEPDKFKNNYINVIKMFNEFNDFIIALSQVVEYPFSKELYGISNRNYKFQISIAMILAGIYNKIYYSDYNHLKIKEKDRILKFRNYINEVLNDSFLEDPKYSASSTNPTELNKLISDINLERFMME